MYDPIVPSAVKALSPQPSDAQALSSQLQPSISIYDAFHDFDGLVHSVSHHLLGSRHKQADEELGRRNKERGEEE